MTFRWNEAGVAELEEQVIEVRADVAEQVAERARSYAPIETGRYRDSIHVERAGDDVIVVADVPYAVFVEYGTADTPTFAPLTRAASETRLPGA